MVYASEVCNALWPDVSPDGAEVVFAVGCTNPRESGILIVNLIDGEVRIVENRLICRPKWSPDGEWIAFVSKRSGGEPELDVWVTRPDGSDARVVMENTDWPAWIDPSLLGDG